MTTQTTENVLSNQNKPFQLQEPSPVFRMVGSKVIYNHNRDPNAELNLIKYRFNIPSGIVEDNSWNKSSRYIGNKLYQDYICYKNERDHQTAVNLLNKNSYMENSHFECYKDKLHRLRKDQKNLLQKRKFERISTANESQQPVHEKTNVAAKKIFEEFDKLDKQELQSHIINKSGIRHNLLNYHDNIWNQHFKLNSKQFKKKFPEKVIKLQEEAIERISDYLKEKLNSKNEDVEKLQEDVRHRYAYERNKRDCHRVCSLQFNVYDHSYKANASYHEESTKNDHKNLRNLKSILNSNHFNSKSTSNQFQHYNNPILVNKQQGILKNYQTKSNANIRASSRFIQEMKKYKCASNILDGDVKAVENNSHESSQIGNSIENVHKKFDYDNIINYTTNIVPTELGEKSLLSPNSSLLQLNTDNSMMKEWEYKLHNQRRNKLPLGTIKSHSRLEDPFKKIIVERKRDLILYDNNEMKGMPLASVNGKSIYAKNKSMDYITNISQWALNRKKEIILADKNINEFQQKLHKDHSSSNYNTSEDVMLKTEKKRAISDFKSPTFNLKKDGLNSPIIHHISKEKIGELDHLVFFLKKVRRAGPLIETKKVENVFEDISRFENKLKEQKKWNNSELFPAISLKE